MFTAVDHYVQVLQNLLFLKSRRPILYLIHRQRHRMAAAKEGEKRRGLLTTIDDICVWCDCNLVAAKWTVRTAVQNSIQSNSWCRVLPRLAGAHYQRELKRPTETANTGHTHLYILPRLPAKSLHVIQSGEPCRRFTVNTEGHAGPAMTALQALPGLRLSSNTTTSAPTCRAYIASKAHQLL